MKRLLTICTVVAIVFIVNNITQADILNVPGAYSTIHDAINAANPAGGDTIQVAAGTYAENLVINKQLTLQGAGAASTTIDPTAGAAILLEAGGMTIRDLCITGAPGDGIRAYKAGGFNLNNVTLENLLISGNGAKGIELHNGTIVSDMTIANCEITDNTAQGLRTSSGTPVDGLLITDSSFNGNSYGIYTNADTRNLTISNSTMNVNDNYGIYMSEWGLMENISIVDSSLNGNGSWGFVLWSGHTAGINGVSISGTSINNNGRGAWIGADHLISGEWFPSPVQNILIEDSSVVNNSGDGIKFGVGDLTNVAIHYSIIEGNLGVGAANYCTGIVDATLNWWGDASGPYHPTSWLLGELEITNPDGLGDAVTDYVLYSPWQGQGGLVTGGGTIWSEAGDYALDPAAEGQASFGFVAKYKKGANVPDGNTNFVFSAGELHFHSSDYEWLIVAGDTARFKGTGTIDGLGDGFKFMLWADDDNPDTFRIKIWEEIEGVEEIIYDNGANDPITGGNIVVHKG